MTKEIFISSTPHETRLAIVEDEQLVEIHYERENEYTLAGSMYKGKVTRVLPGMQSAFVDIGLERDAFLYVTDFLEDQDDSGEFERTALPAPRTPRTDKPEHSRQEQSAAAPASSVSEDGIEIPSAGPEEEGMEEEGGARRWRGRRGRRRGSKGKDADLAGSARPVEAAEGEQPTQLSHGLTLEINSDDLDDSSWTTTPYTPPVPAARPEKRGRGSKSRETVAAADDFGEGGSDESNEEMDFQRPAVSLEEPSDDWQSPEPLPHTEVVGSSEPEPEAQERRPRRGSRRQEEEEDAPTGPPSFVLPGESLSKYGGEKRGSSASAPPKNATLVSAKPSTMIESPITWDGGLTLPGESLSRQKRSKEVRPSRDRNPARQARAENAPPERVEDHPTEQEVPAPIASDEVHVADVLPAETGHADDFEQTEEVIEESEAQNHEQYHHEHETDEVNEGEEQQADAQASHKVDPNPPSEFRLKKWFGGKDKTEEEHDPHTGTSEQDKAVREQAHELAKTFASKSAPTQEVFPGVPDLIDESEEVTDRDRHFAPGSGQVEEETIDDEEYDYEPLGAHGDEHDSEDLVEETLEHNLDGTDIGEFVRDTYVNERTSTAFDGEDEDEHAQSEDTEEDAEGVESVGTEAAAPQRQRRGRRGRRGSSAAGTASATDASVERTQTAAPERTGRSSERNSERVGERSGERSSERTGERPGERGRESGRRGPGAGGHRRQSAQTMSLPAITELLKPGQEILVQIAKEPIAKKGARITSHIALPGRFLVYMPTVNHVGVSRKIASEEERQRLKRVLLSEKADASGGFIVRTAAGSATEQELRADIRFLINLWTEIKQRSETAKPPSLIYHDLSLIERILRDQVTDKFSAIWVDTEAEYERVVKFLSRFQPSLVRHVKLYSKETPLFEQFGIQEEVNKALKSKVWLKSGGSIVINQTEALVAIDINTGKYVGKTARLEDTILRTNLDSIPEIVRQVRLRDLGGIIVIDFIDMDERRNRNKVMAALEEELKRDRAPSKVLQFNDFGLVAITRKRVKQSLERTLSMPCMTCQGTGMVKNPTTVCNEIYVELRKMHKHLERGDVMLRVHPEVVKQLKTNSSRWLQDMEEMAGRTIIIKSDAAIHPEQFDVH